LKAPRRRRWTRSNGNGSALKPTVFLTTGRSGELRSSLDYDYADVGDQRFMLTQHIDSRSCGKG